MAFYASVPEVVKGLNAIISRLEKIKACINESNVNHFEFKLEEKRDFEEIHTSAGETGFRQMSPDVLVVTVTNTANLGTEYIATENEPWSGPWRAPTRLEIEAIDRDMKNQRPVPKAQREKAAARWRKIQKNRNKNLRPRVVAKRNTMKVIKGD